MKFIKVYNINEQLEKRIDKWESGKNKKKSLCGCCNCINKADRLIEVKEFNEEYKETYLLPVCKKCSNKSESYNASIDDLEIYM